MKRKISLFCMAVFCTLAGSFFLQNKTQAAVTLSLGISPNTATVATGDTLTITYTVAKNGASVQGAAISDAVTQGAGTVTTSCTTNASGQCTVTYTAPSAATTAQVTAIAALSGDTSNNAFSNITVAACSMSDIAFNASTYKVGDTISMNGRSYLPMGRTYSVCLYDPNRNKVAGSKEGIVNSGNMVSITAPATAGVWTGVLQAGATCPALGAAADCKKTVTVASANQLGSSGTGGNNGTGNNGTGGNNNGQTPKAQQADKPLPSIATCDTNAWHFCNPLAGTIDTIMDAGEKSVQTVLGLIGTIALLFLVYAGMVYMTAAGSEEKIKQAKKIITGTIIGLGIALLAFSLLQTVLNILG